MPLRALLYRRPTEPQAIEVVFDRAIYLVRLRRHRQARRYTLRIQAATREVVLTMPPRGSLKEAREFAEKYGGWIAARLKRLPEAAPFDTIIVAAGGLKAPPALKTQLAPEGRLLIPVGEPDQRLLLIERQGSVFKESWHEAVRFVPLLTGTE